MQDLNCLIVEDEQLAAEVVRDYINQVPGLKLHGICENVMTANAVLQNHPIDLIFLDINLPGISGIEFIQTLNRNYDIILTTAYHQYAVDGFNMNVVDYLLKPIEFSRFLKAVNKVFEKKVRKSPQKKDSDAPGKYHFFNTGRRQVKVNEDDIVYIESLKDYVKIHAAEKEVVTKYQIGQIEQLLDTQKFMRVHKSFIINMGKITAFSAYEIEIDSILIPIGKTYKELVDRMLAGLSNTGA